MNKKKKKLTRFTTNSISINLICSKCKVKYRVTTTQPELYTKEVKKNILCINCNPNI